MPKLTADQVLRDPAGTIPELCRIDVLNIESELARQADLMSFAVIEFENCKAHEASAKTELDKAYAQQVRNALQMNPREAEWKIRSRVLESAAYQAYQAEYTARQWRTGIFKGLIQTLEHKKDMLVQLASRQRAEMSSHPS